MESGVESTSRQLAVGSREVRIPLQYSYEHQAKFESFSVLRTLAEQKLQKVFELSAMAKENCLQQLREKFPEKSEREIVLIYLDSSIRGDQELLKKIKSS